MHGVASMTLFLTEVRRETADSSFILSIQQSFFPPYNEFRCLWAVLPLGSLEEEKQKLLNRLFGTPGAGLIRFPAPWLCNPAASSLYFLWTTPVNHARLA